MTKAKLTRVLPCVRVRAYNSCTKLSLLIYSLHPVSLEMAGGSHNRFQTASYTSITIHGQRVYHCPVQKNRFTPNLPAPRKDSNLPIVQNQEKLFEPNGENCSYQSQNRHVSGHNFTNRGKILERYKTSLQQLFFWQLSLSARIAGATH